MASSRLFAVFGPSIVFNSRKISQAPSHLNFNKIFKAYYTSSALSLDSDSSSTSHSSAVSAHHPWPEWVNFVDRLKDKGYLTQNGGAAADNEYTDMKPVKDACLSFARDRFDIFRSLSTQDIQTVVEKGCPNLFRKSVNSAKRLRAYLDLDEGDVCSSCNLRGSCDRAYVMLNDVEAAARTVDVVRILLLYALDPLVVSEQNRPPGRELIESSARKLLSQLIELGETHPDPDLPKRVPVTSQRTKKPLDLSVNERSKTVQMKQGDWVCTECNFMNFAKNIRCLKCKADGPKSVSSNQVEMKKGDWNCPQCNFMNFARNVRCLKCKAENSVSVDAVEMKKGDWNCPQCSFMNFANKQQCFRCQEPRPEIQMQLRPGDWECPDCNFLNFARNTICRNCNLDRPKESATDQGTWKKPY